MRHLWRDDRSCSSPNGRPFLAGAHRRTVGYQKETVVPEGTDLYPFCPTCGTEATPGHSFCSECGRSLIKTPVPIGQGVSRDIQDTDVATANRTQLSSEVASMRKKRSWLLPVGVAMALLVAAAIIFGVPQIRHDVLGNGSTTAAGFGVPCSQNPACRNSGNSGNTGQTPEQHFANDAMGIQTVLSAVNNGTLTRAQIGSYGDSICNLMPQRLNQYGPGPSAFNSIANEFYEGLTHFRISGTDDGTWVALAITDICGAYVVDIPAGVTP